MPRRTVFRLAPVVVVLAAALVAQAPKEEKVSLVRAEKETSLKYRATHAEFFKAEGDPQQDVAAHGEATFTLRAVPEKDGAVKLDVAYSGAAGNLKRDAAPLPETAFEVKNGGDKWFVPDCGATRFDGVRVVGAGPGPLDVVAADWFSAEAPTLRRLAASVSALGRKAGALTHLGAAVPALPAQPVGKDDGWDGDFLVGYLGREAQVQVFHRSTVLKTAEGEVQVRQAGKPRLIKFPKPASLPAKRLEYVLDEDKSWASFVVDVSRADGFVLRREGEMFLVFQVHDPATPDDRPKVVTARLWSKLERL
ncbi:MAG TPA: hypothetical protein VEI02_15040 [Planctomycetota bacterium]|nr:hypothetical protein [Planctomycetota bacterium]